MKRCPKCNLKYEDDSLRFCLDDGTALTGGEATPTIAAPTLVLDEKRETLSQVNPPDVPRLLESTTYANRSGAESTADVRPGSSGIAVFIAVVLALACLSSFVELVYWKWIFVRRIPIMVLGVAVMILALIRVKQHPRSSLMAGLALGLYLITGLMDLAISSWLRTLQESMHLPDNRMSTLFTSIAVLDNFAIAVVFALLVAAVFTERNLNLKSK